MSARSRGNSRPGRRPATTSGGRENQLISMAIDLAEKRMTEGTASAQEICHFLKLGSTREELEQQRLMNENLLTSAKIDALASAQRIEELYTKALDAMKSYSGQDNYEDSDYD